MSPRLTALADRAEALGWELTTGTRMVYGCEAHTATLWTDDDMLTFVTEDDEHMARLEAMIAAEERRVMEVNHG